jgi:hypothetical protein
VGRVVIAWGRRGFADGVVVVVVAERKSVRREEKAALMDLVRRGRVLGTVSERGVERAMRRAAARRERVVW